MSEARLRDIALTSGDIIWQSDGAGRLVYVAGQSESLLGVNAEQAVGMPVGDSGTSQRECRQQGGQCSPKNPDHSHVGQYRLSVVARWLLSPNRMQAVASMEWRLWNAVYN